MPAGRKSARRQAVFYLYQWDLLGVSLEELFRRGMEDEVHPYTRELATGVAREQEDIDRLISLYLEDWTLERLGFLERAILRVAVYELLHCQDVPEAVAIDEAVELAKRYCSVEAGALVNGVLGGLVAQGPGRRPPDFADPMRPREEVEP